MEETLNNLKARADRVALTAEEKSAGREMLRSFMALMSHRVAHAPSVKPGRFGFLRLPYARRVVGVSAASFALLLSAGGISYAAEGAIPGDALYPVKVSVNEPVRAALTVSEKKRAEWEAERAGRRLSEAEELARRGALKPETRVALDADFRRHAEDAKQHMAKVREQDGNGAAADVSAKIESTLRAHRQIMSALTQHGRAQAAGDSAANNDDGDAQVAALEASVDHEVVTAAKARGIEEARVSTETSDKAAKFVAGRHDAAVKTVANVRSWLATASGAFTEDSLTQADARLSAADAAVTEGGAALAAGKYQEALAAYGKAQRQANEAKLIVRASNSLDVRVRFRGDEHGGDSGDSGAENGSAN